MARKRPNQALQPNGKEVESRKAKVERVRGAVADDAFAAPIISLPWSAEIGSELGFSITDAESAGGEEDVRSGALCADWSR